MAFTFFFPDQPGLDRVVEHNLPSLAGHRSRLFAGLVQERAAALLAAAGVEVLRMFHSALAPGGLFATEQTQGMPRERFSLFRRVTPEGQVFRKAEGIGCAP